MNAVCPIRSALQKLAGVPDEVTRKRADGSEEKIPLDTVKKNDRLIVVTN